jgi:hypothetical protein
MDFGQEIGVALAELMTCFSEFGFSTFFETGASAFSMLL